MPIALLKGNYVNKLIVKYLVFWQIYTVILIFVVQSTLAQQWYNDGQFHPGFVITKSKNIHRGNINYNQSNERLTCFTKNGSVQIESKDVLYYQFYDVDKKMNRYFYSKPDVNKNLRLYELLLTGKINLYRKSILSNKNIKSQTNTTIIYLGQWVDYMLYYEHNNVLKKLNKFDDDILPLMKSNINEVSNFITEHQLDLSNYNNQIEIIDFYNGLTVY